MILEINSWQTLESRHAWRSVGLRPSVGRPRLSPLMHPFHHAHLDCGVVGTSIIRLF